MFLHSGASLHGHEYSSRDSPSPSRHAAPRRNSLLRSSFSTPINKSSPHADSRSISPSIRTPSTSLKKLRPRPVSDYSPVSPDPVVRFLEPLEHDPFTASKPEVMDDDDASTIVDLSDSDTSRATSSVRQPQRRSLKQQTSYLLAQAPPTLNKKQRFLHLRPKLLLQLQHVPVHQRPKPVIDVYPTTGIVNTAIAAHLCKRFPRLSRIKSEKSIQDVLLFKSEDYSAPELDSDSDGDEESLKNRDVLAILSPLTGQDKAEIALPDGTVWVAAPRTINGNTSYEFTTVDENGTSTTARWVRRTTSTRATPSTEPTTPVSALSSSNMSFPFPPASPPLDYKFTFSIIDPNCRRHPIMATLQSSSLEIQDTYTTGSQSFSKYPPTSPQRGASTEPSSPPVRTTRDLDEAQKSFIQISALWVALRHGWVPHFKPADFIPQSASISSPTASRTHNRSRSYSTGTDVASSTMSRTLTGRLRNSQPPLREEGPLLPGILPRRATSTGAARMAKIRAERFPETSDTADTSSIRSKSRRVLSGDWNGSLANRHSTALAGIKDIEPEPNSAEQAVQKSETSTLASGAAVMHAKRPVSDFVTSPPRILVPDVAAGSTKESEAGLHTLRQAQEAIVRDEPSRSRKRQKWKSVTAWFNRLRAR